MSSRPKRTSRLSPERLRRLHDLLAREGLGAEERIERRAETGPGPLSHAQERLWFLCRMRPSSPVFNIAAAYRIRGAVDVEVLSRAIEDLVRRHGALRTRFVEHAGRPAQELVDVARAPLAVESAAGADEDERIARALDRACNVARRPFDLEAAPLARFVLYRLDERDHLLCVVVHHIVSEVQSVGILIRDLCALYAARAAGAPAALPELPLDFVDYAAWQRARTATDGHAAQLGFWRERLAGALPTLELPTDRPRPPVQGFAGDVRTRTLDPELAREVRAWCSRRGRTLFAPFLAAWAALLGRYARTEDLVLGVPITDRDRAELEGMVGFFVNTLVLRCDLSGEPGFDELVGRVQEALLGAQANQGLPFEHLVEVLQPERDLSRTPLFQAAFLLQYAEEAGGELPELAPGVVARALDDPLALHTKTSKFDVALVAFVGDGGIRLACEYSADLFEPATIDRMLGHVENLLAAGLRAPEEPCARLPMLADEEVRTLLAGWNPPAVEGGPEVPVHELVARRAAAAPDAPAVVAPAPASDDTSGGAGETVLSYGELDEQANRLARRLAALGVGPDVPVAVCMDRSPALVVALLGTLKAGGAYLPVDMDYPRERLAFLLSDSGAPVVLSRAAVAHLVPDHGGTTLLVDGEAPPEDAGDRGVPPSVPTDPAHLAYVIYTSGSTGTPKGVAVEHRGLSNLVRWHCRAYDIGPADRATHLAGLAFDASVWELWPPLVSGATLVLVPDEVRLSPGRLVRFLAEQRITSSFLPTPLCEAVLREELPANLALRHVLTGGDKLHRAPDAPLPFELVNHYGPTEASVVATAGTVEPGSPGPPPIGRPIDGVQVHLLDAHRQLVPAGVPGELHVGGKSLARGYHRRPELTHERFVPHPFEPGARLYATGDLARWRPDGRIEFLGRLDDQVQVRGHRVEPGEIEGRLGGHPGVVDCAVELRGEGDEAALVAWFVPAPGEAGSANGMGRNGAGGGPEERDLRAFLRETLPAYMVPAAFVRLDALPLTPNGKVDRRALPDPAAGGRARDFVAPRGDLEERIAAAWRDVLGRDAIDADANFFDVGGHSLLVARLQVRLRENLGRELSIVELFQYPTVGSLAAHLEEGRESRDALAESMDRGARRRTHRRPRRRQP